LDKPIVDLGYMRVHGGYTLAYRREGSEIWIAIDYVDKEKKGKAVVEVEYK
jgi:hypothetical protein